MGKGAADSLPVPAGPAPSGSVNADEVSVGGWRLLRAANP